MYGTCANAMSLCALGGQSRYAPNADIMRCNRFEKLTSFLHFCDNLSVTPEEKGDKLWKLRLWLKEVIQD